MSQSNQLLLIEDDQVDALTIKRALTELGIDSQVIHMTNGVDALDYLTANASTLPRLILLDLNMPRMNGIEFLRELKADPDLMHIPVVVLTTSKEEQDITGTFQYGVAGYMIKPLDYSQFVNVIQAITRYWDLSAVPIRP